MFDFLSYLFKRIWQRGCPECGDMYTCGHCGGCFTEQCGNRCVIFNVGR